MPQIIFLESTIFYFLFLFICDLFLAYCFLACTFWMYDRGTYNTFAVKQIVLLDGRGSIKAVICSVTVLHGVRDGDFHWECEGRKNLARDCGGECLQP